MEKKYYYDLHCHTEASPDSTTKIDELVKIARGRGLAGIAITDHDKVYLGPTEVNGVELIRGAEITLDNGCHLLAYFLKDDLPFKNSPSLEQAVSWIHTQGGIAVLAHLYRANQGWLVSQKITESDRKSGLEQIDGLECLNAKDNTAQHDNAKQFYNLNRNQYLFTAGSDAHTAGEVGQAVVKLSRRLMGKNFKILMSQADYALSNEITQNKRSLMKVKLMMVQVARWSGLYRIKPLRDLSDKLFRAYNEYTKKKTNIHHD